MGFSTALLFLILGAADLKLSQAVEVALVLDNVLDHIEWLIIGSFPMKCLKQ